MSTTARSGLSRRVSSMSPAASPAGPSTQAQAVERARQAFTQHNVIAGRDDPGAALVPLNIVDPARAIIPAGRK
jgi:hypothetical protein